MKQLETKLREAEDVMRAQLEALCYPNGRKAAYQRIDAMCSAHATVTATGGIDRSSNQLWRNTTE